MEDATPMGKPAIAPLASNPTRQWLAPTLLFLLVPLAYLPAIRAGWIWDDDAHVTENAVLTTPRGLAWIWTRPGATPQYYPLTHTTFWIERHAWGLNPIGYHAVNILIHALSTLLFWRILLRLQLPPGAAFLAAALFALHPVQVESVAWVTERKNTLSGLFFFASAIAFLKFWPPDTEGPRSKWRYALALLLFICAALSKTVSAALPAALVLVYWWKQGTVRRRQWLLLTPMFIAAVFLGWLTAHSEKATVGARGPEWDLSFLQRILIASRALWFYLAKLLLPIGLNFNYPRWEIHPASAAQWLFPIAALLLITTLFLLRQRIGRGPLVAFLYFGGTLFPALGFVNLYPMRFSFVADHFQYLACISLFMLFSVSILKFTPPRAHPPVIAAIILLLLPLTFLRSRAFRDEQTLWQDALAKNDRSWIALDHLSSIALEHKDIPTARALAQRSVSLYPHIEGYIALGNSFSAANQNDDAQHAYQQAVDLRPDSVTARMNLAAFFTHQNKFDQAIPHYRALIEQDPRLEPAYIALARIHEMRGQGREAIDLYIRAIEQNPDAVQARLALASISSRSGDKAHALELIRDAKDHALDPESLEQLERNLLRR